MTKDVIYDTVILGGGPGGYTAALYAVRAGLNTLVLEKFSAGGQMTQTANIDNYPGFESGIDGFTLGDKMKRGAERFGAETKRAEVLRVDLAASPKRIDTDSGVFYGKTVIVATGADHKTLGLENEEMLLGRGVGYCAACDGMMFRGRKVAVVGGGNTAVADALLLSKICQKVYLIHRRDTLRAEKVYEEALKRADNVELRWNSEVTALRYDKLLTGITLKNKAGEEEALTLDGLFISIGRSPNTALFEGQLKTDKDGYLIADETTRTEIDGVFAVGDVRTKPVRQIVTATADGAVASHYAEAYIAAEQG